VHLARGGEQGPEWHRDTGGEHACVLAEFSAAWSAAARLAFVGSGNQWEEPVYRV